MRKLLALLLFLAWPAAPQQSFFGGLIGPGAIISKPFAGITLAQASAVLPNVGQHQHVIVIVFPNAVADVSPIQVRIEASFDGTVWFPISTDSTAGLAKTVSGNTIVYRLNTAYAPFPLVRINSLLATPGAEPMDVFYVGNIVPIVPAVIITGDRIIL
jgi:hypothetical protein